MKAFIVNQSIDINFGTHFALFQLVKTILQPIKNYQSKYFGFLSFENNKKT